MRLLYLSLSYVPSRRASAVHVMKMCAALARQGHQVELITKRCPPRQEPGVEDDHRFYGVEPIFRLDKLPRPAWRGGGLVYSLALERRLRRARREAGTTVFSRDLFGAWRSVRLGLPTIFEAHGLPKTARATRWHRELFASPHLERLVVISQALAERFEGLGLLPPADRLLVAHDAADPMAVAEPRTPPWNEPQIGYIGHLYPGRGVEVIVALAERLPQCSFHLVGGRREDVERWRATTALPNLTFHGFVAPGELADHYGRFDILLMPYQRKVGVASGKTDTSGWMSPMKMFEYLATGRPIVSSDLPVLREVLRDEDNALLVAPEDVDGWAQAIQRLLDDGPLARRLGEQGERDFRDHYTWDARARAVLDGLGSSAAESPRR
ncbi:MAG: glycosyltransferase family 4 protein [Acidobacteriota bacterium]